MKLTTSNLHIKLIISELENLPGHKKRVGKIPP